MTGSHIYREQHGCEIYIASNTEFLLFISSCLAIEFKSTGLSLVHLALRWLNTVLKKMEIHYFVDLDAYFWTIITC